VRNPLRNGGWFEITFVDLDRWADRVLDAETLTDVFAAE